MKAFIVDMCLLLYVVGGLKLGEPSLLLKLIIH